MTETLTPEQRALLEEHVATVDMDRPLAKAVALAIRAALRTIDAQRKEIERIHEAFDDCEREWTNLHDLGECCVAMARSHSTCCESQDSAQKRIAALEAEVDTGQGALELMMARWNREMGELATAIGLDWQGKTHEQNVESAKAVRECLAALEAESAALREACVEEGHYAPLPGDDGCTKTCAVCDALRKEGE